MKENEILQYFNDKFSKDIDSRLSKLSEEMSEMQEAIESKSTEKIIDELCDVFAVAAHTGHCLGYSMGDLLNIAYDKCKIRETDPGYKH